MRLEDTSVIVETNATDGDAGLQFFLDGEPWRSMKIFRPGGKKILDVNATGRLKNFGLTELFSETNEPEFKELPFSKFKRRFPEGTYKFVGRSIEGRKQVGKARLSHRIPDGPEIIAPAAGSTVPDGNVVARWAPAPQPGDRYRGLPGDRRAGGPIPPLPGRAPGLADERHDPVRISRAGHRVPARDSDDRKKRKPDDLRTLLQRGLATRVQGTAPGTASDTAPRYGFAGGSLSSV